MRVVGKHAENNYAPLYQYWARNRGDGPRYGTEPVLLGLPRELTIERSVK